MDTISHAIVAIAATGLSGREISLSDPVYWAAIIGSQAPDFDITAYAKGEFYYLKQHRSFSHSLLGILLWPALTTAVFFLFFKQEIYFLLNIFSWCLIGAFSHIALDYLNTHGVAFFWPRTKKRRSLNLLNVFDPCLLLLMLLIFTLKLPAVLTSVVIFSILGSYILFRYFLHQRATRQLAQFFGEATQAFVLPSLKRIFFWDFIIKTPRYIYVGQIGALNPVLSIRAKLPNEKMSALVKTAKKTNLGIFFSVFTPLSYFKEELSSDVGVKIVRIYDLRYCFEQGFTYSAAIEFTPDNLPFQSHIYAHGRKIETSSF